MRKPVIPHDALVFVGDGAKALFLRNDGDEKFANFVTERGFIDDNPWGASRLAETSGCGN